jgi:hypothetical protein
MEDLLIYIANGLAITINYYQLEEVKFLSYTEHSNIKLPLQKTQKSCIMGKHVL